MRVLVFSEGFGARTLTFVYNEVKALSEFCDVHVLCTEKGDAELLQYDKVTEIKWQPNKIIRRLKWELWKRDLVLDEKNSAFSKKLNELIDSFKPDVIHCHFGFEALKVTENFTRNDIPVIVTFHGYDATEFDNKESYKRKLKATFDRPNIFPMFVSDYIRQRVARLTVNTEKGFLLYLGIDLDRFKRKIFPDKSSGVQFIQISSFAGQKGHVYTVEAIRRFFDKYPDSNARFVFGGGGAVELDVVRAQVKKLNLENKIHFTGKINPEEVRQWLDQSHYFIHPSVVGPKGETEGLPTAIMEAMAMELPILSTYHAGIPELVQPGINGLLVNEKDIDAYVAKFVEIQEWSYCPQNRTRVFEMCEIKSHTRQLISVYQKVIHLTLEVNKAKAQ